MKYQVELMNLINRYRCLIILLVILTGAIKASTQPSSDSCVLSSIDIHFKKGIVVLTSIEKRRIDTFIKAMKSYPLCKVLIEGHGYSSEGAQQISWDKVESVAKYFHYKGVDKKNFVLSYGLEGNPAIVMISGTTEDGPNWIPAPHPCYSLHLPRSKRCVNADGGVLH